MVYSVARLAIGVAPRAVGLAATALHRRPRVFNGRR